MHNKTLVTKVWELVPDIGTGMDKGVKMCNFDIDLCKGKLQVSQIA